MEPCWNNTFWQGSVHYGWHLFTCIDLSGYTLFSSRLRTVGCRRERQSGNTLISYYDLPKSLPNTQPEIEGCAGLCICVQANLTIHRLNKLF